MGEDPDRIRQDIEATRNVMGETVDGLTYKADVQARARAVPRGRGYPSCADRPRRVGT